MMVTCMGIAAATQLHFEPQLHLMGGSLGDDIVWVKRAIVGDDDR